MSVNTRSLRESLQVTKKIAMILGFALGCATAFADVSKQNIGESVFDNISSEYTVCAAYFSILSAGFEKAGDANAALTASKASEAAFDMAYNTAKQTRSDDIAQKVTASRLEFYGKGMLSDIDNNFSNISILANQHASRCKAAIEKPVAFMEKVMNEVISK
jgi:hypothetical protein